MCLMNSLLNLATLQPILMHRDTLIKATLTLYFRPSYSDGSNLYNNAIKNSDSTDADNIQIRPVKYVIDLIAPLLTHIFNVAIAMSVFQKGGNWPKC